MPSPFAPAITAYCCSRSWCSFSRKWFKRTGLCCHFVQIEEIAHVVISMCIHFPTLRMTTKTFVLCRLATICCFVLKAIDKCDRFLLICSSALLVSHKDLLLYVKELAFEAVYHIIGSKRNSAAKLVFFTILKIFSDFFWQSENLQVKGYRISTEQLWNNHNKEYKEWAQNQYKLQINK